tara:strand:+ start:62 stop:229 length:168 start_codon:yes stop_codon:yes gene_type:complete
MNFPEFKILGIQFNVIRIVVAMLLAGFIACNTSFGCSELYKTHNFGTLTNSQKNI